MRRPKVIESLAKEQGLKIVDVSQLTIRRIRCGKGFSYRNGTGCVRDAGELARLKSLAVPPAYDDVRYAANPSAHLQAVGTDAAGRLQYRYHANWTVVREALKARRLTRLASALPAIRRAVAKALSAEEENAAFAICAVVRLVTLTAIRPGSETYAKEHGTRGATTLMKSNIRMKGPVVVLEFKAKGGKPISKEIRDRGLHTAFKRLMALPGRRLFQYRDANGELREVRANDVNDFLRSVAGRRISLKDFRTLVASAKALDALAKAEPESGDRKRRAQIRNVVTEVAEELGNTPTVCRTSYVHGSIVTAFETGKLPRLRKPGRSIERKAELLARLVSRTGNGG
jgi:DNA topoisomerase-1